MFDHREPLEESDMDVVGALFAYKFIETEHGRLVELYIEDDGWYHFKCLFSDRWLPDLIAVSQKAYII